MSDQNWQELIAKFNQLEHRFQQLEQSLQGGAKAVQVTGAAELPKLTRINTSEFELVDIYQNSPQILASIAIKVGLTADSYRKTDADAIYLEKSEIGNYWIIVTESDTYWLVPKDNFKVNVHVMRTLQALFKCQEYNKNQKEFSLKKPARVFPTPDGQQWKFEEPGELDFSNNSPASQLQEELQRMKEERQQILSQLKQLNQDFWQLKEQLLKGQPLAIPETLAQQLRKAAEERQQLRSEIEQLKQAVKGATPSIPQPKTPTLINWQLANNLTGHNASVRALAMSSWKNIQSKQIIVSGGYDNTIRFWDWRNGELIETLKEPAEVNTLAISPTDLILISGSNSPTLQVRNLKTAKNTPLNGHSQPIFAVAISPDGNTLVSGSSDRTIKIWDLQTLTLRHTLSDNPGAIIALAISPDGNTLVSGSDKVVKIWNLQTGKLQATPFPHDTTLIRSLAISPDGKILACGYIDGVIKLVSLKENQSVQTLKEHSKDVYAVAFSPSDVTYKMPMLLASGSSDTTIKLWDYQSGQLLSTLTGHTSTIYALTFSPDGQMLISGSQDQTIKIWKPSHS